MLQRTRGAREGRAVLEVGVPALHALPQVPRGQRCNHQISRKRSPCKQGMETCVCDFMTAIVVETM